MDTQERYKNNNKSDKENHDFKIFDFDLTLSTLEESPERF